MPCLRRGWSRQYKSVDVLEFKLDEDQVGRNGAKESALEWFQLAREVRDSATTATNGIFYLYPGMRAIRFHFRYFAIF